MPGTNAANRRRKNIHKLTRTKTLGKRRSMNAQRKTERESLVITAQQKRQLLSNPQANLEMSSKKMKKMNRMSRILTGDTEMVVEKISKTKTSKIVEEDPVASGMEVVSSGAGTILGGAMA